MTQQLTISVAGCGWLGLPLAESLNTRAYKVKGSTTSPGKLQILKNRGIDPYLVHFGAVSSDAAAGLLDCDVLIIAIPPSSRSSQGSTNYREMARFFTENVPASRMNKIILISSTSVYPELNCVMTEDSTAEPGSAGGKLLLEVEEQFLSISDKNVIILRLAGLVGPERHPGRFFKGREAIPNGLAPINLIHRDDVIGIIHRLIDDPVASGVYNACSSTHPSKVEFYRSAAASINEPIPEFVTERGDWKIVSARRIADELKYDFIYPDLARWIQETVINV